MFRQPSPPEFFHPCGWRLPQQKPLTFIVIEATLGRNQSLSTSFSGRFDVMNTTAESLPLLSDCINHRRALPMAFLLLLTVALYVSAQKNLPKRSQQARLPRIGTIKNLENVIAASADGCGNHFLVLEHKATRARESIFISDAANSDAWMNLDGRDVRLKLGKTTLRFRQNGDVFARHEYRAGNTHIAVSFHDRPDYIYPYPAKIIVRNNRRARLVRAVGLGQCGE